MVKPVRDENGLRSPRAWVRALMSLRSMALLHAATLTVELDGLLLTNGLR